MPSSVETPPRSSRSDPTWQAELPVGRDLDRLELRALALAIAQDRRHWQPFIRHDEEQRHYVQLHRDMHLDVWLICWSNQQDTGLHDHDISSGAVHVCKGELVEDRLELRDGALHRVSIERPERTTFDFDPSEIHCVRHAEGKPPAISIHVYSPALWRMGYYDTDENGLLRRSSMTYAEETTAA